MVTDCISFCLLVVFVIEFATENGFSRGPVRQQPGCPGGDALTHAGLCISRDNDDESLCNCVKIHSDRKMSNR